ncbi:MAG: serine/threonine-protein kinase [Planctomycetota bacterium]
MNPSDNPASPADSRHVPTPTELAASFPQYEIQTLLGRGGMGAVFRARHLKLDRLVALKVLLPDLEDLEFAERFEREARALARLSHPGIVAVHDFGEAAGRYFLVMEYVEGANLRELIASHRLTPSDVMALIPQICDALQYAHDVGVVHRDIKPENILIDQDGRARIADFGLAKMLRDEAASIGLTRSDQVVGTLHYMAPEQMGGAAQVDHRADLYSLGVLLYEMLTGELPIGRFAPPSAKSAAGEELDAVVLKSLESEPGKRYQQARQVKTDLQEAGSLADEPGEASAVARPQTKPRPASRFAPGPRVAWGSWLAFGVVLVSSFVSWGAARGREHVWAWDGQAYGVPFWIVVVLAGLVAALRTARLQGGEISRLATLVPVGLGLCLSCSGFVWVVAEGPRAVPGPGGVISLMCFTALLRGELSPKRHARQSWLAAHARHRRHARGS